jgi:hypothetical protein
VFALCISARRGARGDEFRERCDVEPVSACNQRKARTGLGETANGPPGKRFSVGGDEWALLAQYRALCESKDLDGKVDCRQCPEKLAQ